MEITERKEKMKVFIAEIVSGLGLMVRRRLSLAELDREDIILASTHQEALGKAENARQIGIRVAIIGRITRYGDLLDEQELIDILRMKVPGIVVISCTGRTMLGADIDIPRPYGYLEIEKVVSGLFKKKYFPVQLREGGR